ncbi:TPA: PIN-like domain-containing protein [Stenotrophomonas maltophilia]
MRSQFSGYFDPRSSEIDELWHDGAIALDTNVLLGLYRMPNGTREQIFQLLTQVQARLWVPYHVLVEFHRNRLEVMRTEYAASKELGKEAKIAYDAFKAVVSSKRVQERACWPELNAMLKELNEKASELFRITQSESDHYISPAKQDTVLPFVEDLLRGRTGIRPQSQELVQAAEMDGANRYAVKMGPGYLDTEKAGDLYMFDGLTYDRQYGDYMVWRELLRYGKDNGLRRLMLVTSDVKADWWLDTKSVSGKRPQPELVMEMHREAGVETFWMYTLSEFIQNAKERLKANVTDKAITDARQTEEEVTRRREILWDKHKASRSASGTGPDDLHYLIGQMTDYDVQHFHGAALGYKAGEERRKDYAVLVIDGTMLLFGGPPFRAALREAFGSLSERKECDTLQIYVIFEQRLNEDTVSLVTTQLRVSISKFLRDGMEVHMFGGHFLDPGHKLYQFGLFLGALKT